MSARQDQPLADPTVLNRPDVRATWVIPWLIAAAGILVYLNSFHAPFIFDDLDSIVANPALRHAWPPTELWRQFTDAPWPIRGRPLIILSFALNYAISGLAVWSYHALNLLIHVAAALLVWDLFRRTCHTPRVTARYGAAAPWLAGTVALWWVVHPLQTQSVTYITQRAESLMALWYVLAVYGALRHAQDHRRWWAVAAVLACAAGMGTKAVMVTAPLAVWVYDRLLLSDSWFGALRRRPFLYGGMAASWGVLAWWLCQQSPLAPVWKPQVSWGEYFLLQPGIILHYLRLAVWPHPLCLDYAWPTLGPLSHAILPGAVFVGLLVWTRWMAERDPLMGWCGSLVWLVLAPTVLLPVADIAEHRMYLPLAGVLGIFVFGGWRLLRRVVSDAHARRAILISVVVALTLVLGGLTIRRNADYASAERIWQDTVRKQPGSWRAQTNLGLLQMQTGRTQEGFQHLQQALWCNPDDAIVYSNLGSAFAQQDDFKRAV